MSKGKRIDAYRLSFPSIDGEFFVHVRREQDFDTWRIDSGSWEFCVTGVSEERIDAVAAKVADFERRLTVTERERRDIGDEFLRWRDGASVVEVPA